jgi:hypothetical protein
MSQLIDWQIRLAESVDAPGDVNLFDADEARNRVRIGVRNEAVIPTVLAAAAANNVPQDALHFEVRDGTPEMWGQASTWTKLRPTGGGIQIAIAGGTCTLGHAVRTSWADPARYFLTNSHCTLNFTGGTGHRVDQPVVGSTNRIGTIVANPAWQTVGCSPGVNYCRLTDVALGRFDTNNLATYRVAVTTVIGSGSSWGNTTLSPNWQHTGPAMDPLVGHEVFKTGRTSGTTRGPVAGTCVNTGAIAGPSGVSIQVTCATEVQMWGGPGDSGAPAYHWQVPFAATTRAASGIVFGGTWPQGGIPVTYLSPMSLIRADLGYPDMGQWP